MRGTGENLQQRLEKLEQTGDEVLLLRKLEKVIAEHGLVEFRSTLSMILDRLGGQLVSKSPCLVASVPESRHC